ncbi:MAG: hypothetical protein FWH52_06090 [Synergistaceae bacterium]|nr:hypothetical protein [Synergistaceae bacterium]
MILCNYKTILSDIDVVDIIKERRGLTMLEKELDCFSENLNSLLEQGRGKFVLIYKDKIVEIFNSREDAINCGYKEFGITPFLVKQIKEFDEPLNFTSNIIMCEKEHKDAVIHSAHS